MKQARCVVERFEKKYTVEGDCWIWHGSIGRDGYGKFRLGTRSTSPKVRAHRACYLLHVGDIPDGDCVLHRCDVPLCVNPDHLFLGDARANAIDRERKGRGNQHRIRGRYAGVLRR